MNRNSILSKLDKLQDYVDNATPEELYERFEKVLPQIETPLSDSFSMLLSQPVGAIFALVNEFDKRVYVGYSATLQTRLGAISGEILNKTWKYQAMIDDCNKLQLKILETRLELNFVKYYMDQYRNMGYEIYNATAKVPLKYTFSISVFGTVGDVKVVATSSNRANVIVLGSFKKFDQATEFLIYITNNNPTGALVYNVDN